MIWVLFFLAFLSLMFLNQGYKEEIFSRIELSGFKSKSEIQSWLAGPNKNPSSYSNFAVQLQEPFAISEQAKTSKNLRELSILEQEANTLEFGQEQALIAIQQRVRVLEGEAQEEKQKFKEAESLKERELAEERLRELTPKALGGIKSGETRRGKAVLRSKMFD